MKALHYKISCEDVCLYVSPLCLAEAMIKWVSILFAGSKTVLLNKGTPQFVFEAISCEHCTTAFLPNPLGHDILKALDQGNLDTKHYQLSQLRLLHTEDPSQSEHWLNYFPVHKSDFDLTVYETGSLISQKFV